MTQRTSHICDRIWRGARLMTMASGLGVVEDGLIACRDGKIVYAGQASDAPPLDAPDIVDVEGRWITPGLIDCHTHLVYAGTRADEFAKRQEGVSYEDIARAGGGILSTVTHVRRASEADLVTASLPRLDALLREGVTTVEIKSGYGLTLKDEMKMLRVADALGKERKVRICTTFLGAHALPAEFKGRADEYIDLVCNEMMPAMTRLADACDAFCETVGFTREQTRRVFEAARKHGLHVKLHAEQLSNSHGAALAAEFGALSADHLEYLDEDGIAAMARSGTVAVLLPAAFYFMQETKTPPIAALRAAKIPMAIATDCNPGTAPLASLLTAMNMAAVLFRLNMEECLTGVTREAARALGLLDDVGTLEAGKYCDLAIWDIESPAELVYRLGAAPLYQRIWRGE